jgi:hypothetical protein
MHPNGAPESAVGAIVPVVSQAKEHFFGHYNRAIGLIRLQLICHRNYLAIGCHFSPNLSYSIQEKGILSDLDDIRANACTNHESNNC